MMMETPINPELMVQVLLGMLSEANLRAARAEAAAIQLSAERQQENDKDVPE